MWCALHAVDLSLGEVAPDGSEWIGPDGVTYARNPRGLVTPEVHQMMTLWSLYRSGGMGAGLLPDPGGTFDQSTVMLEAFGVMSEAATEFTPKRSGE